MAQTSPNEAGDILRQCGAMLPRRGRFLDVGSNDGRLLYHFRERGWEVVGVEINPRGVEIAARHGLPVICGTIEEAGLKARSFDLVNLGDIIEHTHNPDRTMAIVSALVRPGGVVRVATPNADSGFPRLSLFLARLTGDLVPWHQSEPPYHLQHFTTSSLSLLLKKHSLSPFRAEYQRSRLLRQIGNSGYFDDLKLAYLRSKYLGESLLRLVARALPALPGLITFGLLYGGCKLLGETMDRFGMRHGDHMVVYAARNESRN